MLKKTVKVCVVLALTLACLVGVVVQFQPVQASGYCCDSCHEQRAECLSFCAPDDFPCRAACNSAWVQCIGICC